MRIEAISALTPMQQGMLFHELEGRRPGAYHEQYVAVLASGDPAAVAAALQEASTRHGVLRTFFSWEDRDEPLQLVRSQATLPVRHEDWRGTSHPDFEDRWEGLLAQDRAEGFNLQQPPLARLTVVRETDDRLRALFSFHHIILDGWSVRILVGEILRELAGRPVRAPEFNFVDFVDHHRKQDPQPSLDYWKRRLAGFDEPSLPFLPQADAANASSTESSSPFGVAVRTLPRTTVEQLRSTASEMRVTQATLLYTAWAVLLGRTAGQQDVAFGVVTSGRDVALPNIDGGVGLFLNTLPLRCELPGDQSGKATIADVHERMLELRDHGLSALGEIQKVASVPRGVPLFETVVVIENVPELATDTALLGEDFIEYSHYPLSLIVHPNPDRFALHLIYDPRRVTSSVADTLLAAFVRVLAQLASGPEGRLQDLSLAPEPDSDDVEVPPFADVLVRFDSHAARQPSAPALITEDTTVSYAALAEQSEHLARGIRTRVGSPGGRPLAVLLLEDKAMMIAAMLASLRLGYPYAPLDSNLPPERLETLLTASEQAGYTPVIVSDGMDRSPQALQAAELLALGATAGPLEQGDAASGDAAAYVMFTSGSTGTPKGVRVTRRNLAYSTGVRDLVYEARPERFLVLSPLYVDSSVAGLYWTLCTGGALLLAEPRAEQTPRRLLDFCGRNGLTHLLTLPSLYRVLLEHDAEHVLGGLGCAVVAGEACSEDVVEAHYAACPAVSLYNEYGPTEGTVWATVAKLRPEHPVSIGHAIPGTRALVVDREGRPLPPGLSGELWIAGPGIADGYINAPDDPFVSLHDGTPAYRTGDQVRVGADGALFWQGRIDQQIKHNGYRIEPAEIESVLRDAPKVQDAAVVVSPTQQLVAYVVGAAEGLDRHCRSRLPAHMVPSRFIELDTLPTSASGKVDRRTLSETPIERDAAAEFVAPRSAVERTLAQIWCDVLGLPEVSVTDDFFSVGGDSLLSVRILSRVHRAGLAIEPEQFFAAPTIEGQASIARPRESPRSRPGGGKARAISAGDLAKVRQRLKDSGKD